MVCQIVVGPQLQDFTLKCCFLIWRRASENFDYCPKMQGSYVYDSFFLFYAKRANRSRRSSLFALLVEIVSFA